MALEDPQGAIGGFDPNSPVEGDEGSTAPAEFRMIKLTLQQQFRGASGNGLSRPLDLTEEDFEACIGSTGNFQQQINEALTRIPAVPTAVVGNIVVFAPGGVVEDSGVPLSSLQALLGQ